MRSVNRSSTRGRLARQTAPSRPRGRRFSSYSLTALRTSDTFEYVSATGAATQKREPALPPGPRAPRAVQTLAWILRPGPFMTGCRRRYGDTFTVRIANEGTWVFLVDP